MIEAFGSTSLVEIGSNYYLDSIGSGSGPELKYGGAPFAAGQSGAWTPIGVEQTATGYEVAWKVTGADQYSVWNTDSNGNYISNSIGVVSGTSAALESLETSFHQDLNGDGVIGVPTGAIVATGEVTLTSGPLLQATWVTAGNDSLYSAGYRWGRGGKCRTLKLLRLTDFLRLSAKVGGTLA